EFSALFDTSNDADDLVFLLGDTLTDFAVAHEVGHWWARDQRAIEEARAAAQEATAHVSALSLLVAYHHYFRDTGLFDAMARARLNPVVAPLLIQVLHVCFLRYLYKISAGIFQRVHASTREARLLERSTRLAESHRLDLLHFQLMLQSVKQ